MAVTWSGCGGETADVTGPAMALPQTTLAMVSVDLRATGSDASDARALARALGARSPSGFAGPVLRAALPDATGLAALFLIPARDGVGVNSGVVLETRDARAALDAARRIRPLVRAQRRARGGAVRDGTGVFRALDRLTDSPTAAAATGHWVIWGDPRAVRAAVVAANGLSLGETVPFRRTVEPFRDGTPALLYLDPRGLTGALVARALGITGSAGHALSDRLLGVRFARAVAGRVRLESNRVTIDMGTQDGCPDTPLTDAGGGPADAALVAGAPVYGLAQRQCVPFPAGRLRLALPHTGVVDFDSTLGWLEPSRLAVRGGGLAIAARVRSSADARHELPRIRRILGRLRGVRATLHGGRLDVSSRGHPRLRATVTAHRALLFVGPLPGPSRAQAKTTAVYRAAQRALGGNYRLTALAVRPRRGVAYIAVGQPTTAAQDRGSGARVVIALR